MQEGEEADIEEIIGIDIESSSSSSEEEEIAADQVADSDSNNSDADADFLDVHDSDVEKAKVVVLEMSKILDQTIPSEKVEHVVYETTLTENVTMALSKNQMVYTSVDRLQILDFWR